MLGRDLPTGGGRLRRGLGRRCPVCGAGAFESWFTMRDRCPQCGLVFEREHGYWVGAVIVNTTVTFAAFILTFVAAVVLTWPDVPWGLVLAVTLTINLAVPIFFYPISKSLWLALEVSWHPPEPGELNPSR